jgi:hypothetical protein
VVGHRGPTRPETKISEGESYARLAKLHSYWNILPSKDLERMILVEERALDSFHNMLFSITKFHEVTGHFPERITIVSNEFKRARFLNLHSKALRWSSDRINFIGIDPDYMAVDLERAKSVREGEKRNGFEPWEKDMYGAGAVLQKKRDNRNPWLIAQSLFETQEAKNRSGLESVCIEQREFLGKGPYPWELPDL